MVCLTMKKNDTKIIKDALKTLGKENFALIVHGSSFPACDGDDTGFGSFNSESGHAFVSQMKTSVGEEEWRRGIKEERIDWAERIACAKTLGWECTRQAS